MPSVLNTDPIVTVLNATCVPNVPTVPNVPKMTMNDPSVPKKTTSCTNKKQCTNRCTKRNDCNKRTENDQEWSYCARIRFRAFLHGLLKEPIISPLKFKMANGRHIENRFWPYFLFSYCILGFDKRWFSYRLRYSFFQFLLRISILRRNIDIGILSVTLRYWMKTA